MRQVRVPAEKACHPSTSRNLHLFSFRYGTTLFLRGTKQNTATSVGYNSIRNSSGNLTLFYITGSYLATTLSLWPTTLPTLPQGQGHHNSVSQLPWARITYPTLSTFPVGGNRSTRRKPTTFGRAFTILFSHEDWVQLHLTGDRTRNINVTCSILIVRVIAVTIHDQKAEAIEGRMQ